MGLHNKFPSYFYKRGNLFNTYLRGSRDPRKVLGIKRPEVTQADLQKLARLRARRKARRTAAPTAAPPRTPPAQFDAASKFVAYAKTHLSNAEGARLLTALATHHDVRIEDVSGWRVWSAMHYFLARHISHQDSRRYLEELQNRAAAGAPLLRP